MIKHSVFLVISILFACSFLFGCSGIMTIEDLKEELSKQVVSVSYDDDKLEKLTIDEVRKMHSKDDLFSLFYAASVPEEDELKGEYDAELLDTGGFSKIFKLYINKMFGPADTDWTGKAFGGVENGKEYGYNIFKSRKKGDIKREVRFETFTAKTTLEKIDCIESYHLKYETYNDGLNGGVRDEIRKINDQLYLGIGSASWGFGTANPGFFVLYGKPNEWKGVDEEK